MLLKKYFAKAEKEHFAIGAFNAASWEVVKAIIQAAEKLSSPVIIESSPGETAYLSPENLADLVENSRCQKDLPIFVNLDHGESVEAVRLALKAGYDMVHFDGSSLGFEENKRLTRLAVAAAKKKGVVVEGELGHIPGKSELNRDKSIQEVVQEGVLTDPYEAKEFVQETGIDVLAAFIGNVHGIYKEEKKLDLERLSAIKKETGCWLSLHGGSGITQPQLTRAIQNGVVKINVNTELRLAFRETVKQVFGQSKEAAVYKLMPPVIEAVQKVVEEKIKMFGSAGKA